MPRGVAHLPTAPERPMHDRIHQLAQSEVFLSYVLVMAGVLVIARFFSWVHQVYREGLNPTVVPCDECGCKMSKHALFCPECGKIEKPEFLVECLREAMRKQS